MGERLNKIYNEACELNKKVKKYQHTFQTFEGVLKSLPLPSLEVSGCNAMRGRVIISNDRGDAVELIVYVNSKEKNIEVSSGIEIGPRNLAVFKNIILPNPNHVSLEELKEINEEVLLDEIVSRINDSDTVRKSFLPSFTPEAA